MTDRFKGNRPDPFLITPIELLRNKEFIKWHTMAEYGTWSYLYSYIIRAEMEPESIGTFIFENYYQKGLLAARWNQKQMAENMGKSRKSNGQISRHTRALEAQGFLYKEYRPWQGKKTLIYVLGTRDFTSRKHETIYAFEYFYNEIKKAKKAKKESKETLDTLAIIV